MRRSHARTKEERYWRHRTIMWWCGACGIVLLCGIVAFIGTWTYAKSGRFIPTREILFNTASVRFIDVGQGDATLLLNAGHAVLIDTGKEDVADRLCAYLQVYTGRIDILFLTHDHADHNGGAERILHDFRVGTLVIPDTGEWSAITDAATENRTEVIRYTPNAIGMTLHAGKIDCTIIGPVAFSEDNGNNNSLIICAELWVNDHSCTVLITGDAGVEEEASVLSAPYAALLHADLLKIAHHGSSSSTSLPFFYAVDPKICVISCGSDNEYGHPHNETIALLTDVGIPYCRTDREGNIVFDFDGEKLTKRRW